MKETVFIRNIITFLLLVLAFAIDIAEIHTCFISVFIFSSTWRLNSSLSLQFVPVFVPFVVAS